MKVHQFKIITAQFIFQLWYSNAIGSVRVKNDLLTVNA